VNDDKLTLLYVFSETKNSKNNRNEKFKAQMDIRQAKTKIKEKLNLRKIHETLRVSNTQKQNEMLTRGRADVHTKSEENNQKEKRPLGRRRRIWEGNIKMNPI
jgi:hypothetical protein